MEQNADNMQKYANYKEQMGRLKRALKEQYYLEAIAIEYAIIEDRIEPVLRHSGVFRPDKHNMLNKKLNKLSEMQRNKKSLVRRYFSEELIGQIHDWKNERNPMTHALLNLKLHTEDLAELAQQGEKLVKTVSIKTSLYNKALARQQEKTGDQTNV